jgi:hypothetical protein
MTTNIAKLVCFGRGGDSVEYGKRCHGSGYGTPERPHAADPKTCTIPDGTIAIDKRTAIETPAGYAWVFNGPMVNVDLQDGDCSECPEPSPIFAGAVAGNEYGSLLTLQAAHKTAKKTPGPLDFVSIAEYVEGWRAVGARIGRYVAGKIVWEN